MSEDSRVRQNYWALLVATLACFALEAGWYDFFLQKWLDGIGRTMAQLVASGISPVLQYGTALASCAVMAAAISCVTQLTGPQTAYRGMRVATALWMGFVITIFATAYVFEGRPWSLLFINAGFWFFAMNLMGLIVGAWKAKVPASVGEVQATAKA